MTINRLQVLHTKSGNLIDASTADLLQRYRRRELSPVEVLEAQIERLREVEPLINA
jgi:Asp-tRNA(Asn)/Glu-tRNA(Gln) amidotransferase A subunit family amidase